MSRGEALLAWYRASARDLPWRRTTDPYRILAQRGHAPADPGGRVVAHYERFLTAFPTVERLADATLAEVLDAWSGLGYNKRAAHLREAARRIVAGGWPTTVVGLRSLPGLGPYTAAAVASFAFGQQAAAVDTNVRRVISRWEGQPLTGGPLAEAAAAAMRGHDAATWNQAIMELGATLCRPRRPRCDACPVASWCDDPTVYEPPPRQAPFEGSTRQGRGAVVRALSPEWATLQSLADATGHDEARVANAIDGLVLDGLAVRDGRRARLAD
jgi:A/G-specific adenine glycosylase